MHHTLTWEFIVASNVGLKAHHFAVRSQKDSAALQLPVDDNTPKLRCDSLASNADRNHFHILRRASRGCFQSNYGQLLMSNTLAMSVACGFLFAATSATAADRPGKPAVKQASATCRAEVKDRAKYNEMSLWAQHKAVKKCVADALGKH
jgi:hypothetical protein